MCFRLLLNKTFHPVNVAQFFLKIGNNRVRLAFGSLLNECSDYLTTTLVVTVFLFFGLEIAVFDFLLIFVVAERLSEFRDRDAHSGLLIPESTSAFTVLVAFCFGGSLFDDFFVDFSATLVATVDFDLLRSFVLDLIGSSITFLVDARPI